LFTLLITFGRFIGFILRSALIGHFLFFWHYTVVSIVLSAAVFYPISLVQSIAPTFSLLGKSITLFPSIIHGKEDLIAFGALEQSVFPDARVFQVQ